MLENFLPPGYITLKSGLVSLESAMETVLKSKAEQLQDFLLEGIRSGAYPVGGRMPSIRDLVRDHNICKFTVAHVYNRLHELGYIHLEPRKAARVIKSPAKHIIQLRYLNSEVQNEMFWGEFYRGIHDEAPKFPEYEVVDVMGKKGEICVESGNFSATLALGASNISMVDRHNRKVKNHPLVYVYNHPAEGSLNFVSSDFSSALNECAEVMAGAGCRRIISVIWEDKCSAVTRDKIRLIRSAAEKYSIEYREVVFTPGVNAKSDIYHILRGILSADPVGNGIFLVSDQIAAPVLRAAHDCGIRIPEDLKVVGCDNLNDGAYYVPALTTIELDRYEQGRAALRMVVKSLENPGKTFRHESFPAKVVYRESLSERSKQNKQKNGGTQDE